MAVDARGAQRRQAAGVGEEEDHIAGPGLRRRLWYEGGASREERRNQDRARKKSCHLCRAFYARSGLEWRRDKRMESWPARLVRMKELRLKPRRFESFPFDYSAQGRES